MRQDEAIKLLLVHRAMLIGYLNSIVRDRHLAEDLFQEVALLVMKKCADLDQASAFPAWIRKMGRFQAMNALRKLKIRPVMLTEGLLDSLDEAWAEAEEPNPSPAIGALRECLEKLPFRSKQMIEWKYGRQVDGKKLSEIFHLPVNTIYVTLSRIHRRLEKCIRMRMERREVPDG